MASGSSANTGQRAFFDELAHRRASDVRRHSLYYADRLKWLKRMLRHDASVIELGCGTGPTLSHLPQAQKTGIDFAPEMIRIAREHDQKTQYFVDEIGSLAHKQPYDYVLLLDTINFASGAFRGW